MATLDLMAERDEAHRRIVDTCNLGDGVVNAAQMRSWRGVIRIRSLIVRVLAHVCFCSCTTRYQWFYVCCNGKG